MTGGLHALLVHALPPLFLAILFLQSGVDKVVDWKGNLGWLTGHFEKSPLKGMVPMMLGTITVLELLSGLASLGGLGVLLLTRRPELAFMGAALSALSLTCLFFGQRMAKDYAGAAGLVPYFLLAVGTMVIELN